MTGGKASRDKGQREERDIVRSFQDAGLFSERIPLSGAAGGSFTGDVLVTVRNEDWRCEAKVRANGFRQLYDWLGTNDALFVRSDRRERLVVMRASTFIKLAGGGPYNPAHDGASSYEEAIKAIHAKRKREGVT